MMRKSDSIPDKDVVIEDPSLEPYIVVKSQTGGYAVYERVVSEKVGKKNSYLKTVCYPSTFEYALKTVADEQVHSHTGTKKYDSIKDYLKQWDLINNKISVAMGTRI